MRGRRARVAALVLANVLLPIATLVFASGFFPYKPVLPGLATFEETEYRDGGERAPAVFDRVIFMVVDALRSDFVYARGSGFEFTQGLIRSGAAIPFTAHATPPTVTMPRVKALTTGSVPSFLDLILNFAESDTSSSLAIQDTWLAQIKAKGGKLIFYGDDTWLKLFPGDFFARSDGTSSFFVSDFTEVDNNVTRHVPDELSKDDWNAMIMHYLGLDHIGHKTGPNGPNMLPKQREMDDIVKQIYEAMQQQPHLANALLVVAGDHGMNAGGNHGGSGPGETEPALVFASPKLQGLQSHYECPTAPKVGTEFHFYDKVEQSDLVPTLAGLMGLPISRNSLGVFLRPLLEVWSPTQQTWILHRNAMQMWEIIEAAYGTIALSEKVSEFRRRAAGLDAHARGVLCDDQPEGETELACRFAIMELSGEGEKFTDTSDEFHRDMLDKFLRAAQSTMSGVASLYNLTRMSTGIALATAMLVTALLSLPTLWPPSMTGLFTSFVSIVYGVMMFASSYVEEEQRLWYWLTPVWIVVLTVSSITNAEHNNSFAKPTTNGALLLALHRLCISWNQTGQKYAGDHDIAHTFFVDHHILMWLLVLATYLLSGVVLARHSLAGLMPPELASFIAVLVILPAIVFKLNFTQADAPELVQGLGSGLREITAELDLVLQAKIVFGILALLLIMITTQSMVAKRGSMKGGIDPRLPLPDRFHSLLTLFLMTQSRTVNIPLFLVFAIMRLVLSSLLSPQQRVVKIATSALLLSHMSYFCMGGSNSISSIDLSNAYNGVGGYNIAAVGVLLFASNWAGPIWWTYSSVIMLTPLPETRKVKKLRAEAGGRATWIEEERARLQEDALGAAGRQRWKPGVETEPEPWLLYLSLQTSFVAASLLGVMAACTALRTHLFIWTVFSPKYLYAAAWSIGWHGFINIGLGGFARWLGTVL